LPAISRFCPAAANEPPRYPADKLTVLYVSPLKALNEDIRRNLLEPLAAVRLRFEQTGLSFPAIRAETRSGDTPQAQRRRFLAHPPSILALTPESLAILLLSPKGRQALSTVKYLILDEIHAVLGNKRGAFLSCQIDRLALLAGEFQRISLSATIRPPQAAAEFTGGLDSAGMGRTVRVVAPAAEKQIELSIEYPDVDNEIERTERYGKRYGGLISYILSRISQHSTILVFTGSRRRAERLAWFINQEVTPNGPVAFAHHGSLSKELRQSVERRLACGELPCVVATASLELGIDIGSVDEVVLAGSPGAVSQALQRIGRSGHQVGRISRGRLFPFHGMDLLVASALKGAVEDRDIEELRPIENPLDILAQIILALCVEKNRNIDELYTLLRGFFVFRNLNRESYGGTVRMLAGIGGKGRLREIKPRIWLDNVTGEIGALDGSLLLLYASGGVIASRGLYSLRLADGTKIGELDEEFVWERRIRDRFHFGGRGWQITAIGTEAVEAVPLENPAESIPFWHSDTSFRSPQLTERVLAILDGNNAHNGGEPTATADTALTAFLESQRAAQGDIPLSGNANIAVEIIDSPESRRQGLRQGAGDFFQAVIHTFRGGAVNYPLSLALAQELEETIELRIETFSNDDAIIVLIPRQSIAAEELIRRAFVSLNETSRRSGRGISRGERLFRNRLEISGVFGANFREAAERSLLLPKAGFGKRTPLWIMRQRSKRLFDAVAHEDGFPATAEAWRTCLNDMFDMEGFRDLLTAINDGSVALSFFYCGVPSPFAQDLVWQETNFLIYEMDERKDMPGRAGGRSATLSDKVIEEALGDAALRPVLQGELVGNFAARLRREIPGWVPEDALSLCEWVKERIAIPLDEWETLCAVLPEPLQQEIFENSGGFKPYCDERLKMIKKGDASVSVVHREWETAWKNEPLTLLGPWLRYEGPVSLPRIAEVFGVGPDLAEDAANALVEVEEAAGDVQVAGTPVPQSPLICDRENLEMLLRLSRKKARPEIRERPAALLVPFLALRQGLITANTGSTAGPTEAAFLKKLAAWRAPAKLWETELCPARRSDYRPDIIDHEIQEGRLLWYGAGKERISLCRPDDVDLVYTNEGHLNIRLSPAYAEIFTQAINAGFFDRPRSFWEIKEKIAAMTAEHMPQGVVVSGINSASCAEALWREVWQGRLSSDSFEPVRRGIENGFTFREPEGREQQAAGPIHGVPRLPRVPRALRDRWKGGAPVKGEWFSLALDDSLLGDTVDPLDEECRNRDRVRLLLGRWGILCRPLLERESPPFTWSGLLPAIRRMELSGELIAGRFFAGINSLQFASPAIARELENVDALCGAVGDAPGGIYWMNAADPASPAGLDIEGLDSRIPGRLPSGRLYFRGEHLAAVSGKNGKEQQIFIAPGDSDIAALIEAIKIPRTRKVLPENKIVIEKINDAEAARSNYAPAFKFAGFVPDRGKLCFW
jgi:ATP-dependent Lhr-like helicase